MTPTRITQRRPTVIEKMVNLAAAAPALVATGFETVSGEEVRARGELCNTCLHWHPAGNLGLGECGHKECGCTKAKRLFVASKCPIGRW